MILFNIWGHPLSHWALMYVAVSNGWFGKCEILGDFCCCVYGETGPLRWLHLFNFSPLWYMVYYISAKILGDRCVWGNGSAWWLTQWGQEQLPTAVAALNFPLSSDRWSVLVVSACRAPRFWVTSRDFTPRLPTQLPVGSATPHQYKSTRSDWQ